MKTTPVKGTNDYLPNEVRVRDYLQSEILRTYQAAGFERITTPVMEDIENLDKSDGGENLGLIFKIMKRGDKLQKAIDGGKLDELSDIGLRYDLTLPLSRYYANNRAKLMNPFKCIQIDRAFRAERPQKGRLREFIQCDIDIIGASGIGAEIELIHTTAKALLNVGMKNFKIKVNDRRILKSVLMGCGFNEDVLETVCISFDKLDKIGADGVKAELLEKGLPEVAADNLSKLISFMPVSIEDAAKYCDDRRYAENLITLLNSVEELSEGRYGVEYDMSLVRGQGYYTGTVFEVESTEFRGAIGGGGRYDNLIGKFINETVPAVGFSIGFERIAGILLEQGKKLPEMRERVAVIYDAGDAVNAIRFSEEINCQYDAALYERPKKLGKLIDKLEGQGFIGFYVMGNSEAIEFFERKGQ